MLQASRRSYVCWQCAFRRTTPDALSRLHRPSGKVVLGGASQLAGSASRRHLATVLKSGVAEDAVATKLKFRENLRKWEAENPSKARLMLNDVTHEGEINNSFCRPQNLSMAEIDVGDNAPLFVRDELVELRSDDATLDAGDLVELSATTSRRPVLAVCLGRLNGYYHFYADNGKWFSAVHCKTLFVVPHFATLDELKPLIEGIPANISEDVLYHLQDSGEGPTRAAGEAILRKLMRFAEQSEKVYQENAGPLDHARTAICDPIKPRYLTLHEIADIVLKDVQRDSNGRFSIQTLYAVHRCLLEQEMVFRPLRHVGHNQSYLFEVSPLSEIDAILQVENWVRLYMESQGQMSKKTSASDSVIGSFVIKARRLIDISRIHRQWSHSGIVGPSSHEVLVHTEWSDTDLQIIRFIEIWSGYQKFTNQSRLQGIGSAILRAVDRYQEARGYLPVTGWTFLQEITWIPPWEIVSRYSTRFPGVEINRAGGYDRPSTETFETYLKEDALAKIRTPMSGITAYCIDDVTAREIDDAVSLERTSNPEEYWIHVHVADPVSSIPHDTPVAKYAETIPEAIYLPGHMESMLPEEIIHSRFSLASGRPCLTFSALVNTAGVVLDEKITANTLEIVRYVTYDEAGVSLGHPPEKPGKGSQWYIGKKPEPPVPNREMTPSEDLTATEKDDLAILFNLGKTMQAKRLEKGATPFFAPRAMATVGFDNVELREVNQNIVTSGDPSIHVQYSTRPSTDLVENAMKLANEIAARWCYKRGIPIPYRTQPHGARHAELIREYMHEVVHPLLKTEQGADAKVWRRLRALIGFDGVSTTPTPHITLGCDMYTKATSPLRRYGDLIVHWQIEAALLEEAKRKAENGDRDPTIKKDEDHSFLPFSSERLDRMLPMLRVREKQARMLSNIDGTDQWILQAMARAWVFGEGKLPETFKLTVDHKTRSRIMGQLDWFGRSAILDHTALNNVLLSADVRLGDVFEVRIIDINVHSGRIFVEVVRLLERGGDEDPEMKKYHA